MPETTTISAGRKIRASSPKAFRRMLKRARFVKTDACFDHRNSEVTIGLWLPDRHATQYPAGWWPVRPATQHWRRYDVTVTRALNYEFQIDQPKPYARLTGVSFGPNDIRFLFDDAMLIRVGVSQHDLSYRRTGIVREDWGIPAWAVTIVPLDAPLVMTRGAQREA